MFKHVTIAEVHCLFETSWKGQHHLGRAQFFTCAPNLPTDIGVCCEGTFDRQWGYFRTSLATFNNTYLTTSSHFTNFTVFDHDCLLPADDDLRTGWKDYGDCESRRPFGHVMRENDRCSSDALLTTEDFDPLCPSKRIEYKKAPSGGRVDLFSHSRKLI